MTVELCMCNLAEKIPASKGKVSMMGREIGKYFYCKKCGKELGQKDIDLFSYELGLKD